MKMYEVYKLFDVCPVRGEGCRIYDDQGISYLDLYGGHAVISIGHGHAKFTEAVRNQLERLVFYSNSVINPLQAELAQKLSEVSGLTNHELFMVNSGAEANENALKLASFYNGRQAIAALQGGFHGRTSAAINVTHTGVKHQAPINKGIHTDYFRIDRPEEMCAAISKGNYAAVIVEAIQGIGGLDEVEPAALTAIRSACTMSDTIFICDEVQCGFGRSGSFFAYQSAPIVPDIVTMAKGMGNGFPVGGILVDSKKMPAVSGRLGSTFGGNHLACTAAMAVLNAMEEDDLISRAAGMGELLAAELRAIPEVVRVKGRGLMLGAAFDFDIAPLRRDLVYKQYVFTGSSHDPRVLRLLPPLCLTEEDIALFIEKLKSSLKSHKNLPS